jgi:hypothetical protein
MATPTGPLQPSAAALRRAGWPDPGIRVSDADRAEIADRLALHFGDGRLDQAEFDQRLDQAMQAKTRADLIGLLADLPDFDSLPPPGDPRRPRSKRRQQRQILKVQLERERLLLRHERREHRRREREYRWYSMRQLPVIILVIAIAVVVSVVVRHIYSIWLVFAVLAFLWLRYAHAGRGPDNRGQ